MQRRAGMMTKFYVAGRFSRRQEFLGVRDVIEGLGHSVTSRWLDGGHQAEIDDLEAMERFAREDFYDILEADILLAFTQTPREEHTNRGGRHVELGMALALGIPTVIVGPLENAFCAIATVHVPDWSHFVIWLARPDSPARHMGWEYRISEGIRNRLKSLPLRVDRAGSE